MASAASAGFFSVTTAMIVLVVGGTLSPVGALMIQKLMRRPVVGSDNPLIRLSVTSAFMIPLSYPVIAAATLANTSWFFPAFAVVVGAHFMPYAYIYQMHTYLALGGVLVIGASMIGYLQPDSFSPTGYFTGAVLVTCSMVLITTVKREINRDVSALDRYTGVSHEDF